uniref:Uncharacterized protein n=1 Tax=Panagrolaimus sp. ES5 TaxID=591445 RepID=A0AC34GXI9_9BILA
MSQNSSGMKSHIVENNLTDEMAMFITEVVTDAYAKHKSLQNNSHFGEDPDLTYIFDTKAITDDIAQKVSIKYHNIEWHCLAGPETKYTKMPRPTYFIKYDIDRTTITDAASGKKDFCRIIIWGQS